MINKKKIAGLFCALAVTFVPQSIAAQEVSEYPKSARPTVFYMNGVSRICAHIETMKLEFADGAKIVFAGVSPNKKFVNSIYVNKDNEFFDFTTVKSTKFTCLHRRGTALGNNS